MYDTGKIIAGLAIFVLLMTSPFIVNMGKATDAPEAKIDTPEIERLSDKKCVESKEYMRGNHMQILNEWRNMALRDGEREWVNSRDVKYEASLQNTCMKCHSNKKKFCDACHNYLSVKPFCWDCHFDPATAKKGEEL